VIHLLGGLAAGILLSELCLRLSVPRLKTTNYRGAAVKVVGGVALAGSLALTEAMTLLFAGLQPFEDRLGLLALAFGFFGLGLADDLFGDRSRKGLGGHLKALLGGVVTTGSLKALGGLALAGLVGLRWERSIPLASLDGLVIALSANFLNLLDLRPGRASKAFLIMWIPLAALTPSTEFFEVSAALAGATLAWLFVDLREKGMLGDSGANMLGAVLGAGVVLNFGVAGRGALLAVLVALTLASERWSFTAAIEKFAPLRWLDRLGRP
jgi:UDP-N-acetylmuramyl pentapeptide phosphotransferase/UDP-N-acetylglucosamine-1-phosphate transferase